MSIGLLVPVYWMGGMVYDEWRRHICDFDARLPLSRWQYFQFTVLSVQFLIPLNFIWPPMWWEDSGNKSQTTLRTSPCAPLAWTNCTEMAQPPTAVLSRHQTLPAARIISWDHSIVTVHCPFCDATHNYGNVPFEQHRDGCYVYTQARPERCTRLSHCHRVDLATQKYIFLFPFGQDERVAWLQCLTGIKLLTKGCCKTSCDFLA